MRQYETFELSFTAPALAGDLVDVDLRAVFTLNGRETAVRGFYDGDGIYRLRYYPAETGLCRWTVSGLVSAQGEEEVLPAAAGRHGIVRAEGTHFHCDDGSAFYPFGTTIYAMVHQPEALVDQTMDSLAAAPFNKLRLCVFPKHYDFNHNEPALFAFVFKDGKPDTTRPCPAFWKMLERRLAQLDALGIQADLILFHPYDHWGFAEMPLEDCLRYLDYLTRRLSALPNVWWSLANEYDLMEKFERDWWVRFAEFIRERDPWYHLLSNHNMIPLWDFRLPTVTHCCIQGSFVEKTAQYIREYGKPVLFDEMCYEGDIPHDWGNLSAQEMVRRFWKVCTCGGYATHGETYLNEEECLWWSKGGVLRGESPVRIGFLRQLLESLPGPLTPGAGENRMFDLEELRKHPEQVDHPVLRLILSLSPEELTRFQESNIQFVGHVEDKAYLYYHPVHCPKWFTINLPEAGRYTVEVIDTWAMTRTVVLEDASGAVQVPLSHRENLAILARKTN